MYLTIVVYCMSIFDQHLLLEGRIYFSGAEHNYSKWQINSRMYFLYRNVHILLNADMYIYLGINHTACRWAGRAGAGIHHWARSLVSLWLWPLQLARPSCAAASDERWPEQLNDCSLSDSGHTLSLYRKITSFHCSNGFYIHCPLSNWRHQNWVWVG